MEGLRGGCARLALGCSALSLRRPARHRSGPNLHGFSAHQVRGPASTATYVRLQLADSRARLQRLVFRLTWPARIRLDRDAAVDVHACMHPPLSVLIHNTIQGESHVDIIAPFFMFCLQCRRRRIAERKRRVDVDLLEPG